MNQQKIRRVFDASFKLQVAQMVSWAEQVAQRPAVQRGRMVNRVNGDAASQLRERHDASDFDALPRKG